VTAEKYRQEQFDLNRTSFVNENRHQVGLAEGATGCFITSFFTLSVVGWSLCLLTDKSVVHLFGEGTLL